MTPLQSLATRPKPPPVEQIPTALDAFNDVLDGGLVFPSFGIVTARPGMGKSTLVMSLAREWAGPRAFFETDMADDMFIEKLNNSPSVNPERFCVERIETPTLASVIANINEAASRGCRFVVLDDFNNTRCDPQVARGVEAYKTVVDALHAAMRRHRLALVLVCHTSRDSRYQNKLAEPELEWLKETGELEQRADWVVSVHQIDRNVPDRRQLRCLKNRRGPANISRSVAFDGEATRIFDLPVFDSAETEGYTTADTNTKENQCPII